MKQQKNNTKTQKQKKVLRPREGVGNKNILIAGIILLVAAFYVLSKVNPEGNNFAGHTAPFIFIISWGLIIAGLLWNKEEDSGQGIDDSG